MKNECNQNINFTRIIYAIACIKTALYDLNDLVFTQRSYIIGTGLVLTFITAAIVFFDRSNILPFKIFTQDDKSAMDNADYIGFALVMYLFYKANQL